MIQTHQLSWQSLKPRHSTSRAVGAQWYGIISNRPLQLQNSQRNATLRDISILTQLWTWSKASPWKTWPKPICKTVLWKKREVWSKRDLRIIRPDQECSQPKQTQIDRGHQHWQHNVPPINKKAAVEKKKKKWNDNSSLPELDWI